MDLATFRANVQALRALDLSAYPKIDAMKVRVYNPYKSQDTEIPTPDPATWDFSKIRVTVTLIIRFSKAQQAARQGVASIEKHIVFFGDESLASMTANVQTVAGMGQKLIDSTTSSTAIGDTEDAAINAVDRGRKVVDTEND